MRIAGLDVAFSNDYMALVIVEKNSDGKIRLVHFSTWRKFDWQLWKHDMRAKQHKFNIDWIYVDKTNNQSVVMELEEIGMRIEGVSFTNTSKYDMIRNATKQIVTGELVMPVVSAIQSESQKRLAQELIEQIREQEYSHESSNVKLTHPQGRHDDLLWALCLALYGVSLQWNTSTPLIVCLSADEIDPPNPRDQILDRVLGRFKGTGITITDVKVTMPGDQ